MKWVTVGGAERMGLRRPSGAGNKWTSKYSRKMNIRPHQKSGCDPANSEYPSTALSTWPRGFDATIKATGTAIAMATMNAGTTNWSVTGYLWTISLQTG